MRRLFMIGGADVHDEAVPYFAAAAGGQQARIAVLLCGGPTWEKFKSFYSDPLDQAGSAYDFVVPDDQGNLDIETAHSLIGSANGIFIGGGHTPTYQRLYATEPLRGLLRARYQAGIPLGGVSAGVVLTPEFCQVLPEEDEERQMRLLPGLGLIQGILFGVHFTKSDALPMVLAGMQMAKIPLAWGLDDGSCLELQDERPVRVIGRPVHSIEMTDYVTGAYQVSQMPADSIVMEAP